MRAFEYVVADSPASARTLVREVDGARFYAGGTTLIDLMKSDVEQPRRVVDISRLPLTSVERRGDVVRIGALARNSDVAYDPLIAENFPAVSEALLSGASGQIRNAATVGGNLLQRTRCTYFRETRWRCNKREPGSGCDALDGFNRGHAVLGTSDECIATYPGDFAVALAALSARVVVEGDSGERTIAFVDFYVLPGDRPDRETTVAPGELITAVELDVVPLHARSHYLKVRDRASYEFALVSVACAVELSGGRIAQARVALGGVGTVPWRSRDSESALAGAAPDDGAFRRAADAALAGARPRAHNGFKVELAKRAIVRALRTVCGGAA
ncbi:MAG TPA: xanthine dehydrogenase family protein subunit M [Candidatus Elarobacter sp.]|nr:xanthine dehydrogenase family protein subunit M [Candidatus Elarobacter sp.]HEV2740114.1 xanthine dehydrogenase family protein subunit M [Candidatus Elarobacter sp.]